MQLKVIPLTLFALSMFIIIHHNRQPTASQALNFEKSCMQHDGIKITQGQKEGRFNVECFDGTEFVVLPGSKR
jgi:hypothetical protein